MASITQRLADRTRGGLAGAPLITYYDLDSGERTELSTVTFGNWVTKTANLLGELAVAEGDVVRLELAGRHPGHWVTFVWAAACWQVGATVAAHRPADRVAVVVVGPDWAGYETSAASEIVACSLHPLGMGFPETLPTGVVDYALEVRGQPDAYTGVPSAGLGVAWRDEQRSVTGADLAELGATEPPVRRLVRPADPWSTVVAGLVTPLNTGGSAVVVVGDAEDRVAHIAESEHATR
ncbi:MAG: TIGR03089 family protein [Actinomycetes bacterium]